MNAGRDVKAHELLAVTSAAETTIRWPIRPLHIRPLSVRQIVELSTTFPNVVDIFAPHSSTTHQDFVDRFGRPLLVAIVSKSTRRPTWRFCFHHDALLVHAFIKIMEVSFGTRKADDFFEQTKVEDKKKEDDSISLSFNPPDRDGSRNKKSADDGTKTLVVLVRLASEYQARTGVDALDWSPARVLFGHRALAEVDIKFRLDVARAAAAIMSKDAAKTLTEV